MKKIKISLLFLLLIAVAAKAQVKDISITFSPAAEYTWWDDKAGLADGVLWGGKVGFGFGEYLELRGIYSQSFDIKTNFENYGLPNFNAGLYVPQDVKLTRWGGEFKANIGTGKLNPYVTLGTGIQNIDVSQGEKLEQIYTSLGLGLKFNMTKRAVFLLEAKNNTYNFNAGDLLTFGDKAGLGASDADFARERLSNWSVQGSLQFYLGGRRPGTITELDQAYLDQFKGGLRGIQLIIEPGASYIAFDEFSQFRDTWFLGGYLGLDFNEYIGVRGFYFHATNTIDINTDFDNLAMYGAEFRANLNDGKGVIPYISLGGGYLNPGDNYLGRASASVKGGEFASGGLGLNVPLGKRVLLTGGARGMLMSGEKVLDISVIDDIQTHVMYSAGVKFTLGKKSPATEEVYQKTLNADVERQMAANNLKIQQMKRDYLAKEKALQKELELAYASKDVDKAVELMEEKNEVQTSLKEIEKLEGIQGDKQKAYGATTVVSPQNASGQNVVQMSPAEFESLIIRILETTGANRDTTVKSAPLKVGEKSQAPEDQQQQIDILNNRIEELEKLLKDINDKDDLNESSATSTKILEELEALNKKVDGSSSLNSTQGASAQPVVLPVDTKGGALKVTTSNEPLLKYSNSSALFGVNAGGATTANVGLRLHFGIYKTSLEFVPELYVGFGESTSYGFSGNVILPIMKENEKVRPYFGAGLGGAKINHVYHGNYNLIVGATLPFLTENLSIDYTMRNSFDYNQIALIYKLPF
jgi:hypothetical protein